MALPNEIHSKSVFLDKVKTIRIKLMQTAYTQLLENGHMPGLCLAKNKQELIIDLSFSVL